MSDLAPTGAYFLLWCLNIILTMFLWPRPVAAVRNSKFCRAFDPYSAARIDPHSCLVSSISHVYTRIISIYLCVCHVPSKFPYYAHQRERLAIEILLQSILHLYINTWTMKESPLVSIYVARTAFRFVASPHHELADYMLEWLLDEFADFRFDFFIVYLLVHSIHTHVRLLDNSWVFIRSTRWKYSLESNRYCE